MSRWFRRFRRRSQSVNPASSSLDQVESLDQRVTEVERFLRTLQTADRAADETTPSTSPSTESEPDLTGAAPEIEKRPAEVITDRVLAGDIMPDRGLAELLVELLPSWEQHNGVSARRIVSIIGRLIDGSYAWVDSEFQFCGRVVRGMLDLNGVAPGDSYELDVCAYPWGVDVRGAVLLESARARRERVPLPGDVVPITSAGTPPAGVHGTWAESLAPGDVILAKIIYSGYVAVDGDGQTSKYRPCVFLRWREDRAVVRAVHDADGYVADHDLGVRLSSPDFSKESVVRNVEDEVELAHMQRKLFRLSESDLMVVHLAQRLPEAPPVARNMNLTPPAVTAPVTLPSPEIRGLARVGQRLIDNPALRHSPARLRESFLRLIPTDPDLRLALTNGGILFSNLGSAMKKTTDALQAPWNKSGFVRDVSSICSSIGRTEYGYLAVQTDDNGHPVLALQKDDPSIPEPVPIDRGDTEPEECSYLIPDDYVTPDLVIMDQVSTSTMVGYRKRVNLARERERLRDGSTAPCVVIGSNEQPNWMRFQAAAREAGWEVAVVNTRQEQIETAMNLARTHGAEVVTIVGRYVDMVREIENVGYQINEVSDVEASS